MRGVYIVRRSALAVIAVAMAITGNGMSAPNVQAASSYVQGSYSAAMTFADEFCSDTSAEGVGPSYNGIGDLVWITAPNGSSTITANKGDLYAPVTVNIAGKFCSGYSGTGGGSNYSSDQGSVIGQLFYGQNTANATFHVTESASLYIGNFSEGVHRINMSLASFFTPSGGVPSTPKDSPNAWTDLYIDYINQWTIRGESYVDNINDAIGLKQGNPALTAKPGDTLNWTHDLRNQGPDSMDRNVTSTIDRTGFTNGWDGLGGIPSATNGKGAPANPAAGSLFRIVSPSSANRTRYTVLPSDGGRTLCQRIGWTPGRWNNNARETSGYTCAFVPFNYNLTPSVTGPSGVGTVGSSIPTVMPRVNNTLTGNAGATTDSPSVEWQLKRVEVVPGGSIPLSQQENGSLPCAHYGNTCIAKGQGTQAFPAGSTSLAALTGETIAPNTPVGTRICYTLSVRPYSQANGNWRHSAPVCVKVSKQPKVQVWGHDVRTRGGIETGTTIVNSGGTNKLFGSWVEYGGFSVGANDGFASGSGLNTGNTNTTTAAAWHRLTFANINDSGASDFGMFALPASLPTITDQFIGAPSGEVFNSNLGVLNSGTYVVGDVAINTSAVGQDGAVGKSIIIVSSGTVTINGNIVYEGEGASEVFTTIQQIPQVVIIARAINITGAVTRVDAWLLTTSSAGMINTCSDVPLNASLNSNVCSDVLTVNGPVVTQHLHLRRTGGSNTVDTAGDPAEIFNLRPDAYIWAYGRSSQSGKAQTVYSVELPPRF